MARFANIYVRFIFALAILIFASSLVFHVCVLMDANEPSAESVKTLFIGNLIVLIPIMLLAEDRNVWKNEFKSCPKWMRIAVVIFAIYGLVVTFLAVAFVWNGNPHREEGLPTTAFFVGFDAISICIPYSVMWAAPLAQSELIRRSRNSVIAFILALIVFSFYHAGYFHITHNVNQTIDSQH